MSKQQFAELRQKAYLCQMGDSNKAHSFAKIYCQLIERAYQQNEINNA